MWVRIKVVFLNRDNKPEIIVGSREEIVEKLRQVGYAGGQAGR
jgi:hypothetical protein